MHLALLPLMLAAAANSFAQVAVAEAGLRGFWLDPSRSKYQEGWSFGADGDFARVAVSKVKDGKEVAPFFVRHEGAYKVGAGACNVGPAQGNLFIAEGSTRCCYSAYMLGKTLVLDEVRSGVSLTSPMCLGKTMKRGEPELPPIETPSKKKG